MPEETITTPLKQKSVTFDNLNLSKWFKYQSQDISSYENLKPTTTDLDKEVEKNLKVTLPTWKLDEVEEEKFIRWLDEDGMLALSNLISQWYSYNAAKALYENRDNYNDITAQWIAKYQKKPSTWQSILQGVWDTLMWPWKFVSKQIDKWTAWVAKQFSDNDEEINQQLQQNLEYMPKLPRADRASTAYEVSNIVSDIGATVATSFIPWLWEAEFVNLSTKFPKLVNLARKYPALAKMITNVSKNWYEWVKDMILLNAFNWEWTTLKEAAEWWLTNIILNPAFKKLGNIWTKATKKISERLEMSWNFNKKDIVKAMKQLSEEGYDVPTTPNAVADWLLERWFKGSQEEIYTQLVDYANKSKWMVDAALSESKTLVKSTEATQALQSILGHMEWTPWLTREADEIARLIKEWDNYTYAELNNIKRMIDKYANPYTKPWDVKAWFEALGMNNLRRSIKEQIEEGAKMEWLGNIKALNKETQVAQTLANGIWEKATSSSIKDLGNIGLSAVWGSIIWWNTTSAIAWWLLGLMSNSTALKTRIANAIKNKWWIWTKTLEEVSRFIEKWWELSDEWLNAIKSVLYEDKTLKQDILRELRIIWQDEVIMWLEWEDGEEE